MTLRGNRMDILKVCVEMDLLKLHPNQMKKHKKKLTRRKPYQRTYSDQDQHRLKTPPPPLPPPPSSQEKKKKPTSSFFIQQAQIVDSRVVLDAQRHEIVEYKLQITTPANNIVFMWHRYTAFCKLGESLQCSCENSHVPLLDEMAGEGLNHTDQINNLLQVATNSDCLQWGLEVEKGVFAYKPRLFSE